MGGLDASAVTLGADEAQRMEVPPDRVLHPVRFHRPTLSQAMNQRRVAASVHPGAGRALTNRWSPGPLVVAHLRKDAVHRYVREAIKLLAAMAPTLAQSIEVARGKAPLHGRTRQPPATSWVTSSSTFTSATETSRDAQLIHIREEGVHRAADAADETVTVWSHTGHITVRGKACLLIVSTLFAPQPSVAFRPARPMGAADMLSHVR